jgi:predicted DNA-binding protein YlxM (UPF0122 family)
MKLYVTQMEKLKELGILNNDIKKVVDIFLSALNDWPDTVLTFDDFESAVHDMIKDTTVKKNIEEFLKRVDLSKRAWEAESLSQIMEVYQFYNNDLTLKEIVDDLKTKMNIQNIIWYR